MLAILRPGLETIGFRVEIGKRTKEQITLPVLYGEQGVPRVRYDVDSVHDEEGFSLRLRLVAAHAGTLCIVTSSGRR